MKTHAAAVLAVLFLLPLVGAGGYIAHQEPSVQEQLDRELNRAVTDDVQYLFIATKGEYKGATEDAFMVLGNFPTEKDMKAAGAPPHIWVKVTCNLWTTSGTTTALYEPDLAQRCTSVQVPFASVQEAFKQALEAATAPAPKA